MYPEGVYDLAGFTVGIVDRKKIIKGSAVKPGDAILGIQSSGVHSNGYSLVRKVFSESELKKGKYSEILLTPTIIYVKPVLWLIEKIEVKGAAHITGGGFYDNIVRVLPNNAVARIYKRCWQVPEIFDEIQRRANADDYEMFRTFNMGIGMALVMPKADAVKAERLLKEKYNLKSWAIGEIVKGKRSVELV
jgi:phosphoribosylformylglycinamidine cyclo-ligase